MAKTGDTSKSKPTARRSRTARPSFTPPAAPAASSAWVYRSDAAAAPMARAVTAAPPAPPAKAAPPRRAAKAPVAAAPAPRASRMTHVMDVVTLPLAVSLMAVLAPMRWLLGSARH